MSKAREALCEIGACPAGFLRGRPKTAASIGAHPRRLRLMSRGCARRQLCFCSHFAPERIHGGQSTPPHKEPTHTGVVPCAPRCFNESHLSKRAP